MDSGLSDDVLLAVRARSLKASFSKFVVAGWLHATGSDYIPGRHVDVLAGHLELVGRGERSRLLVNIPPNCSKSTIIGVLFPAWVWTFRPDAQFLCFSYSLQLSTRDNQKCRDLIDSAWYRTLFPHVVVSSDTDSKQLFELASGGSRRVAAIGGLSTGLHPDYIIIDDPLSRDEAMHPVPRNTVWEWYSQSLSSRGLVRNCSHIVAHQRLHVEDLGGHILKQHEDTLAAGEHSPWSIVRLPMRHDPALACPDEWRTEPGELLCPALLDETKVRQLERALGPSGTRSQLQQDPRRSDSGMIAVNKIKIIQPAELPKRFDSLVRFWDLAATENAGDYTVGVLVGKIRDKTTGEDRFVVLDVHRGQWAGIGLLKKCL